MLNELLNNIGSYLNGECALQDLEGWLLSNLQAILDSGDKKAMGLADELDADLVELSEGLIDERTIRERLENIVGLEKTVTFTFSEKESHEVVSASGEREALIILTRA